MIQKVVALGVYLINLYDPIQVAPLYRDMRELSTRRFWAPRSQRPSKLGQRPLSVPELGVPELETRGRGAIVRYKHLST